MGIRPCLIHFEKKKIIFSSNIKVFKNHESICKLGAFNHVSFIFLKKEIIIIIFSKIKIKIQISKNHASISKLWAFGHASSILKRKKKIIFSSKVKVFKIMLQFVDWGHSAMPHSGKITHVKTYQVNSNLCTTNLHQVNSKLF